ncbi:NmrA family NAD(P)-binding protein [Acidovorax sp. ACV02]|uniref:NAD(P)H-binding protein n=1 Tax=Acidovorax sp. ACV02 TaxID=2769310 RepID=UPI00178443C4|nr:NAD(P)H-binding protein [Acidovorax sp. ACV02]MBD9408395.1 NmrA family NAD(P)-binding protein [Acidovorax sp. ACV02]
MSNSENRKSVPRSILIFGAAAHIGKPLARFLKREAPSIRLRLVSSDEDRCESLRREFPHTETVVANYFDQASLERAVEGMEGIFVIAPSGTDERPATTNLVNAIKRTGCAVHILRCVGMQPESNLRRIPESVRKPPALGLPIQHPIVKQIFDESGLPVTYLNFGATFFDNFLWMAGSLRRERKLVWHNRLIPFIDPRDIAEVAGRLFLSDNHRHIGQFHTLNNGHDLMRFCDVAKVMTEVFGETITHDGSKEAFFTEYAGMGDRRDVLWNFFEYERENEVVWARNDFVERMLGRKPITMREWLRENAKELLDLDASSERHQAAAAG